MAKTSLYHFISKCWVLIRSGKKIKIYLKKKKRDFMAIIIMFTHTTPNNEGVKPMSTKHKGQKTTLKYPSRVTHEMLE